MDPSAPATLPDRRPVQVLRQAGRAVLDLLFPPRCCGCGRLGVFLCPACIASIQPVPDRRCARCGEACVLDECARCSGEASVLSTILSTAVYQPPLQPAIHSFKYEGVYALAEPLGQHMAKFWRAAGLCADLIVPVALHARRVRERGYNQAALLARVLGEQTGTAVDERLLVRTRHTRPQVGLGAAERRANMADAFTCGRRVDGQVVVVVDDVCTTGATLEACGAALKAAGAAEVRGFTLARAQWGRDGADTSTAPAI